MCFLNFMKAFHAEMWGETGLLKLIHAAKGYEKLQHSLVTFGFNF